jgi:hypothetical protein
MEDLADIINVAIEELIRESFELPGFSTLHKEAKRGRAEVNRTLYRRVSDAIGTDGQSRIDLLLAELDSESRKTRWDAFKQDAKSPTLTHVRDLLERQRGLALERPTVALSTLLPEVKLRQFALEAKSLDATTATPSDALPHPHETKWPILYRIVAIPQLIHPETSRTHSHRMGR